VFSANLQVFDQTWYGMHEITADMVTGFAENVERLRVGGPAPGMSSELT
jgi:hypothetical protein